MDRAVYSRHRNRILALATSLCLLRAAAGLGAGYIWYALFLTRQTSLEFPSVLQPSQLLSPLEARRAARKFEVYMRDHDRTVTFDEHAIAFRPRIQARKMADRSLAG
jgi:hypothetical protein